MLSRSEFNVFTYCTRWPRTSVACTPLSGYCTDGQELFARPADKDAARPPFSFVNISYCGPKLDLFENLFCISTMLWHSHSRCRSQRRPAAALRIVRRLRDPRCSSIGVRKRNAELRALSERMARTSKHVCELTRACRSKCEVYAPR